MYMYSNNKGIVRIPLKHYNSGRYNNANSECEAKFVLPLLQVRLSIHVMSACIEL